MTPVANFIQQYYQNDLVASSDFITEAVVSFNNLLKKMPAKQPTIAMSQKDVESLAMLIKQSHLENRSYSSQKILTILNNSS